MSVKLLIDNFVFQVGWILILYAQNIHYLYAARIVNGFVGGGVFSIVPLYLSGNLNVKYIFWVFNSSNRVVFFFIVAFQK